uniref:hypothetical protein n=1 Tax=Bordetella pertussis TaxID=520 RepID=UPI0021CB6F6B
ADLAPPAAGVLAGLVLRPPRASWNGERYTGPRAAHVDDSALQGLPGIVRVLVARDFVGIVATRPELAQQAAARLPVQWRATPPLAGGGQPRHVDLGAGLVARGHADRVDGGRRA